MSMNLFLWVAIALFAGLMFTRVFKLLHLNFPDVTAFLIAGLLIGPFGLGMLGIPGVGFQSFADLSRVNLNAAKNPSSPVCVVLTGRYFQEKH